MKTLYLTFLLVGVSGCAEFACYSSVDYAIEQGEKFCAQKHGNTQCESLKIADKNVCKVSTDSKNDCVASRVGIQTFISIPYYDCTKLKTRDTCGAQKSCEWHFKDPIGMKFR